MRNGDMLSERNRNAGPKIFFFWKDDVVKILEQKEGRMTIAIECYIAACTLLLLFEICFLFLKNAKIQQLKPDHEAFEEELSREIRLHQETGEFSDDFIQTAGRKLSQTKNMITLQNMLE